MPLGFAMCSAGALKKVFVGIDPGTRVAGYGIIVHDPGRPLAALAAGAWKLSTKQPLWERLADLAASFRQLLETYQPTHMCLEASFVAMNPRSAMHLGHARGVFLSEASLGGLVVSELSATSVKKTIAGHGRACKEDLAKTLSQCLGLGVHSLPLDATDALAVAYAAALRDRLS